MTGCGKQARRRAIAHPAGSSLLNRPLRSCQAAPTLGILERGTMVGDLPHRPSAARQGQLKSLRHFG